MVYQAEINQGVVKMRPGRRRRVEVATLVVRVATPAGLNLFDLSMRDRAVGNLFRRLLVTAEAQHRLDALQRLMTSLAFHLKGNVGLKTCQSDPGSAFRAQFTRAENRQPVTPGQDTHACDQNDGEDDAIGRKGRVLWSYCADLGLTLTYPNKTRLKSAHLNQPGLHLVRREKGQIDTAWIKTGPVNPWKGRLQLSGGDDSGQGDDPTL
jgi:hypothetical protein